MNRDLRALFCFVAGMLVLGLAGFAVIEQGFSLAALPLIGLGLAALWYGYLLRQIGEEPSPLIVIAVTAILMGLVCFMPNPQTGKKMRRPLDPKTNQALQQLSGENAQFMAVLDEGRQLKEQVAAGQISDVDLRFKYASTIIPRMKQIHERVYGFKAPNHDVYQAQIALYQFMGHLKMALEMDLRNRPEETGRYLDSARTFAQAFDGSMASLGQRTKD